MEFLSIQNFRYGLDTRRSVMTSTPGVLSKLENAHINAGSEVEKRKSFFRSANGFPDTTFGLEATAEGLVTFSDQEVDAEDLPGGVTCVTLTSPSTYDAEGNPDAMTGVVYSCNFNGKAFVIASFNSGTYAFYDGVVIPSSYAGRVLYQSTATPGVDMTIDQMADALVAQIETIEGWDAENMGGGIVEITSPPGVYFAAVTDEDSVDGEFSDVILIEQNDPGVPPSSATARFLVVNGVSGTPGTYALTAFSDKPGTVPITLTAAPVTRAASSTLTAEAIVDAVNYYTIVTGYTAIQGTDGVTVIIVAPPDLGVVTFDLTVTTTQDDSTTSSIILGGLTATVSPTYVVKQYRNEFLHTHDVFSPWVNALASEGVADYDFAWAECDFDGNLITPGDETGVLPKYPLKAGTNFHKVMEINTEVNAYYKCLVTDSKMPLPHNTNYTNIVHILLSNMKV